MKKLRRTLVVLTVLYWAIILTLTHLPPDDLPRMTPPDKVAHFLAYWGLTMALGVLGLIFRPNWRLMPLILLPIVAAYGAFDELTQPMFRRDAELSDWFADCSAAVVAILILLATKRWMRLRQSRVASMDVNEPRA